MLSAPDSEARSVDGARTEQADAPLPVGKTTQQEVSNEGEITGGGNRTTNRVHGGDVVRESGGRTELPSVAAGSPEAEGVNETQTEPERDSFSVADTRRSMVAPDADLQPDDGRTIGDKLDTADRQALADKLAELGRGAELSASVGKSKPPTPFVLGNSLPESEIPKENTHGGISGQVKQPQQPTDWVKIDWYRYELDFRPLKKGYTVLLRKRLRWSATRYSKTILTKSCPQLTRKMVEQISVGKFTPAAIAALQDGGFADGFIQDLQKRIGKGNGRRKADLSDNERSLLARIESSLVAGSRGRAS